MKRDEILKNIKEQFKQLFAYAPATTPFTTNDGKNLLVLGEDLSVGCEIVEVDDANNQTALNDGEYSLSDGRKIMVKEGKVDNITAPDAAQATESPVVEAKVEMEDGMPDGQLDSEGKSEDEIEEGSETESRLSALELQVTEILQMLQETLGAAQEVKQSQVKMNEQIKKISEEPAGNPIRNKKVYISDKETKLSTSMDEIREIQKKLTSVKGL